MKYTSIFILIVVIFFSCKEEKKSRLFVPKNVSEIKIPKSININPSRVKFSFEFDTNYSNYDTNISNNLIRINCKLENLSSNPAGILLSNWGHEDKLRSESGQELYGIIEDCLKSDYIICFKTQRRTIIPPQSQITFSACFNTFNKTDSLKLMYKLDLVSLTKSDLNNDLKPYQTSFLQSNSKLVPKSFYQKRN